MNKDKKIDILQRAKTLLEEKGWIKRGWKTADGYCLVGAINWVAKGEVSGLGSNEEEFFDIVNELSIQEYARSKKLGYDPDQHDDIAYASDEWILPNWNDETSTTKEDVINFIDEYIAEVEKEESVAKTGNTT